AGRNAMRKLVLAAGALLVLAAANFGIYQKEQLIRTGQTVLLELAPVDPRSLMQGDYMALRFRVADEAFRKMPRERRRDGRIVLGVDANGIGTFRRFDDGNPPAPDEIVMRYRVRKQEPKFATNAYFFQEGHAWHYERARYGEFRVSREGEAILVVMRDAAREALGPPAPELK
ncbi:MAG: GDYXXLXY domain-containing protein, partial [Burkholderiales bacterium]|nr:GDYXXLXY domain-containing protein [Burkholderiales bacterium]